MKIVKQNKLTQEVRKKIKEYNKVLPDLPLVKNGMVQVKKVSRTLTGKEYIDEGGELDSKGKKIDPKAMYVFKDNKVQTVNHEVNMRDEFYKHGEPGIDNYVKWVGEIHRNLNSKQK